MKNKEKPRKAREPEDESLQDHVKRMNRVIGQMEGVRNMLLEGRAYADILAQCKAAHAALKSVEVRLLRTHLEEAIDAIARAEKRKTREARMEDLLELFKPVF